jgi:hypothetical protein
MLINDDKKSVPSDFSDHDERDEMLATEKHWDQESNDPMAVAAQRLKDFEDKNVPLSDEDWDKEEQKDDEVVDHIDAAVDAADSGVHMSDFDGISDDEVTPNHAE